MSERFTFRAQYLDDRKPFGVEPIPVPARPVTYSFHCSIPLEHQLSGLHQVLGAPQHLEDCTIQLYSTEKTGPYLDMELSLNDQKKELDEFYEGRKCIFTLRTHPRVRVKAMMDQIKASVVGNDVNLNRFVISLSHIFKDDQDIIHEFIQCGGIDCLMDAADELPKHRSYVLRTINSMIVYVDGMTGVMEHPTAVQWLYSMIKSPSQMMIHMTLKLLILFVEYLQSNAMLFIRAVGDVDSVNGDDPFSLILYQLKNFYADPERLQLCMALINRTIAALPDQDTFYDVTDMLEKQGMQKIIEDLMAHVLTDNTGKDYEKLLVQLNVYEAALKLEDGDEVEDDKSLHELISRKERLKSATPRTSLRRQYVTGSLVDLNHTSGTFSDTNSSDNVSVINSLGRRKTSSRTDQSRTSIADRWSSDVEGTFPSSPSRKQSDSPIDGPRKPINQFKNLHSRWEVSSTPQVTQKTNLKRVGGHVRPIDSGLETVGGHTLPTNNQQVKCTNELAKAAASMALSRQPQVADQTLVNGSCCSEQSSAGITVQRQSRPAGTLKDKFTSHQPNGIYQIGVRVNQTPSSGRVNTLKSNFTPSQKSTLLESRDLKPPRSSSSFRSPAFSKESLHNNKEARTLRGKLRLADCDFSENEDDIEAFLPETDNCGVPPPPPPPFGIPTAPPPPAPLLTNSILRPAPTFNSDTPPPSLPPPSLRTHKPLSLPNHSTSPSLQASEGKKTIKLHWKEVCAHPNAAMKIPCTVWQNTMPVDVDTTELQKLFESKQGVTPAKKSSDPKKEISVLDTKRSNAINIGMTALPDPKVINNSIMQMDHNIMKKDGIERLMSMTPTEEETNKIREARSEAIRRDGQVKLGRAEDFLLMLSDIDHLNARLKFWMFGADFQNSIAELVGPMHDLKIGISEVQGSKTFKQVVSVLLAVGNVLNESQVKSFHVEYLSKVTEVRDVISKNSLLFHIAKTVAEKFDNVSDLYCEMPALARCSKTHFDDIENALTKMEVECKNCREYLNEINPYNRDEVNVLCPGGMRAFLYKQEWEIEKLREIHRRVMRRFRRFCGWLGLSPLQLAAADVRTILKTIAEFALEYCTTRAKISQMQEKERSRQARLATRGRTIADTMKMNGRFKSDNDDKAWLSNPQSTLRRISTRDGNATDTQAELSRHLLKTQSGNFPGHRSRTRAKPSMPMKSNRSSGTDTDTGYDAGDEIIDCLVLKAVEPDHEPRARKITKLPDRKSFRKTRTMRLYDDDRNRIDDRSTCSNSSAAVNHHSRAPPRVLSRNII